MNMYVTGAAIKALREKKGLTQAELGEVLSVSDKTVSKWETGKGYPDITMLEPIARAFGVSVTELMNGEAVVNENISANMLKSRFYVCPVCGNVLAGTGEAVIQCHGVRLLPETAEAADERHPFSAELIEDEYFVRIDHDMTKKHYVSFIAALSPDRIQLVKLYPEGNAEARFKRGGVKRFAFFCNRDGMFYVDAPKKR